MLVFHVFDVTMILILAQSTIVEFVISTPTVDAALSPKSPI